MKKQIQVKVDGKWCTIHSFTVKGSNYVYYDGEAQDFRIDKQPDKQTNECEHECGGVPVEDARGKYHVAGDICHKCGVHEVNWDKPTQPKQECKHKHVELDRDNICEKCGLFIKQECTIEKLEANSGITKKINEIIDFLRSK